MKSLRFTPDRNEVGERLDKVIAERLGPSAGLSRTRIQELVREGYVTVNGDAVRTSYRIVRGDTVVVTLAETIVAPPEANASIQREALPLSILYEDASIAAIDKPAGMVMYPAPGHPSGTLVNAILARWPQAAQVGGEGRAGIVHRLDKDTSGVTLIAKTEAARLALAAQFAAHSVQKRYLALVVGRITPTSGEINASLGHDPADPKRMAVLPINRGGEAALSRYCVVSAFDGFSLVEVFPRTGRTHQIRVHLAYIGYPIVGDLTYGYPVEGLELDRQFLHAEALTFRPPDAEGSLTIRAPLPDELQRVLDRLSPDPKGSLRR